MNDQFTPEQMQVLQTLATAMGGVTQKAAQSKEGQLWHPSMGWQPRSKAVSSTPSALLGHGPGGLFSSMALEKPVFSAMVLPRYGLQARLPVRPSVTINPLYGIYTGVTATTGGEANGPCDDPPIAGTSKLCEHSFVFSRRMRQTPVINLLDVGRVTNRGEHFDLQLFGNPFTLGASENVPTVPGGLNPQQVLNNEQAQKMFELGVAFSRDTAAEFYTGNPSANSAGGGNQYFYGMDILINTGYRDAITGAACSAADSLITNFNSVDFTASSTGSAQIVKTITATVAKLRDLASQIGLAPVEWVLSMRGDMFYQLVQTWPLQYNTLFNQQLVNGSNQLFIDGTTMARERTDMLADFANLNGQYLVIDNVKVPVVIDDAIGYTQSTGGSFTSTIYVVPMTVLGGQPVTYMEYFDFTAPGAAMSFANLFGNQGFYSASDNGRFLWHFKPPTNFCIQMLAVLQARLMLLTPQLAARITNVKYTPFFYDRGWNPSDTSFFQDGGNTSLNGQPPVPPSFYSPTS